MFKITLSPFGDVFTPSFKIDDENTYINLNFLNFLIIVKPSKN